MVASIVASLVLLGCAASASAQDLSVGKASVVNSCDYDVYLTDVPAAGGGFEQITKTLAPGDTWSQEWTLLSNLLGWSIKLSPDQVLNDDNLLQYEYTFLNDGVIWYDLSCVNGSPWNGNWTVSADTESCDPLHKAYMYSTDNAHGMQASCPQNNIITVTLCSEQSESSGSSDPSPSDSTTEASLPSPTSQSSAGWGVLSIGGLGNILADDHVPTAADSTPKAADSTPTTLATVASAPVPAAPAVTEAPAGNIVTHIDIAYVTEIVTAVANSRVKRHQHHAHGHQHQA